MFGKKNVRGTKYYCARCATQSTEKEEETKSNSLEDQEFIQNKLKPILRQGRELKPIKSLARQLNLTETQLHEGFKKLDLENALPYGYYDRVERVYVRTHQDEELDEDMLLEMIIKSYGFKVFHHQGLTGYMRIGRNIPSRKVLNALHQLRKKDKVIGFKKGPRWLWRLPNSEESDPSFFQSEDPQIGGGKDITSKDPPNQPTGFTFASDDLEFTDSPKEKKDSSSKEEGEEEEQNYSLAELTKTTSPNMGESDDDDDDFEIVFVDAEEEE
ncbi:MAG: hypothetical protein HeimC3_17840 [Candidatus Heimdallarchaeota archaeon LC_3]|nr:MAG: hypothetical protein HeimC3_17840 [Candidatus Heimdallarchaeota archaeon LC_3]